MDTPRPRPQIYISYAHRDAEWCTRLQDALLPVLADRAEVKIDRNLLPGDRHQDTLRSWIDGAAAAVLLVTPSYLQSKYIETEELPHLLERAKDGLRLLWVLVTEADWGGTPLREYQAVNDPTKPLSSFSGPRLDSELERIVGKIAGALGIEVAQAVASGQAEVVASGQVQRGQPDEWSRLSPSSKQAMALANATRLASNRDRVHVEHLIVGLRSVKDKSPMAERLAKAGIRSEDELLAVLAEAGISITPYTDIPPLETLPPLSKHAQDALTTAMALAEGQKTTRVHSRQLTFGVLSLTDCEPVAALRTRGVENPEPEVVAGEKSAGAAGAPATDIHHSPLAGFDPDTIRGKDCFNVSQEALTLAMLVAHQDVKPPLSIALFGDWGSGKTFFMREMRNWVDCLSAESRLKDGAYCRQIVQLDFNAWHYIDVDLWASLAREIFEGLANAVSDRESPILAQERLRKAKQSTKDLIAAREAELTVKRGQLETQQQQLETARQEVPSPAEVAKASVKAALQVPEVGEEIRSAARSLGLPEAGKTLGEMKEQAQEMEGVAKLTKAVVMGFRKTWLGALIGLAAVAVVYLALQFALAARFNEILARWVATVTGLIAMLGPGLATAKKVLARIGEFQQSVNQEIKNQQDAKEKELQARADERSREVEALEKEISKTRGELDAVDQELKTLQATYQIVNFIRQRDASSDYRNQLGTIARAHQDFRRLSDLMKQVQEQAATLKNGGTIPDGERVDVPPIDRIVLYIDDLDRCPEDKVVDVLQAVHLLLAFPLFAVVVGVDPRWLLQSLKKKAPVFEIEADENDVPDTEKKLWTSTPLNYLEKIFQIPYTLRPMEKGGFDELINELAPIRQSSNGKATDASNIGATPGKGGTTKLPGEKGQMEQQGQQGQEGQKPLDNRGAQDGQGGLGGPQGTGIAPVLRPSAPSEPTDSPVTHPGAYQMARRISVDLNPDAMRLEEAERDFMKLLFSLLPSPRATKRFVNVYRLIRASIADPARLKRFVTDGEFQCVQILLAMMIGAPRETADIIRALLSLTDKELEQKEWWEFVEDVRTRNDGSGDWQDFQSRLAVVQPSIADTPAVERFRDWADNVARFSFYSGRVLLTPAGRGESQVVE